MEALEDDLLDPNEVPKKLIELEDRFRRNNLRFDGIMEDPNETWDDCERKVQEVLFNNLNIDGNIEIDRCHRFWKPRGSHPSAIVYRFLCFKDKKNSSECEVTKRYWNMYINEDFCSDTMELRKLIWEKLLEYCRQSKYAYLNYRAIVVRDKS